VACNFPTLGRGQLFRSTAAFEKDIASGNASFCCKPSPQVMLYLQPASMAEKGLHYLTRVGLLQNRMVFGGSLRNGYSGKCTVVKRFDSTAFLYILKSDRLERTASSFSFQSSTIKYHWLLLRALSKLTFS